MKYIMIIKTLCIIFLSFFIYYEEAEIDKQNNTKVKYENILIEREILIDAFSKVHDISNFQTLLILEQIRKNIL